MIYTSPHSNLSSVLGTSPEDIDTRKQGSDRILLMCVIILMIFGVLSVYSSVAYFAETNGSTAFSWVLRHVIKMGIAFILMLIVSKINYRTLAKLSRLGIVVSNILLVAVLFVGVTHNGATRWLLIGGFEFQPSTIASMSLMLHVSVLLSEKQNYIKDFKNSLLPILFWIILTCGLIGKEDFSTAGILMSICLLMMFIGRASALQIGTLILLGAIGGSLLIINNDDGYRMKRLKQYAKQIQTIRTDKELGDEGMQAQQAQIAIAQGGIFGVGIGKTSQKNFIPEAYTDFIFAIIAEEYGLIGSFLLIGIYTLILIRGFVFIARKAADTLGTLLAVGITSTIVMYGFVNAGVASGLLPVTGLPMPFVSYGGTNMVFMGLMVGILLNISKHNRDQGAFYNG